MKKVAILYICTGRYTIFWKEFYERCEKFFLEGYRKEYFVFTDGEIRERNDRIHIIEQKQLGWPFDTLMRFKMFMRVETKLPEFDYIFFLNANMYFQKPVGVEVLPEVEDGGLMAVKHPGFYNKSNEEYTYERNPSSNAYIPEGKGEYYFMGGFNGGRSKEYLQLIESLDHQIKADLDRDIIAIWHDESHLNKYLLDRKCKVLDPSYGYPEGWNIPFEPKIIICDKSKLGGHDLLRSPKKLPVLQKIRNWVQARVNCF
ncbi:hypothetical protein OCK74_19380 [Chitinophagaceae bacterium LB-8]|uniref:Glycosyl transferase family 6 n=1 Tax=Paraflavisolibacter caeni TaxID=2982496 RepID=A0A9X2XPG8_9BACT|nr:family 6 glucosyltransferase [Paraflavisolibacter caeni]MCU7551293.1 hypothetical protein [Paraflavisolibacter caeni]